jgi:NADPH:quinone reductase-like Zn-dependent oxidoreductase
MTRLRGLLREPALLIDLFETLVVLLIAFGIGMSGDQQSYLIAAFVALIGLFKAFTTKPFPVTAVTDFGRAILVVGASFGIGLTADQIALIVTALGTITTLIARSQVTPRIDPVVVQGGAGAGPVAGAA